MIQVEGWAELLGPSKYLEATAIAVAFIFVGKIADLLLSNTLAKIASRSRSGICMSGQCRNPEQALVLSAFQFVPNGVEIASTDNSRFLVDGSLIYRTYYFSR